MNRPESQKQESAIPGWNTDGTKRKPAAAQPAYLTDKRAYKDEPVEAQPAKAAKPEEYKRGWCDAIESLI